MTPAYLARLRELGINRLSVGMQSAIPHVLATLDRRHTPGRPEQVVAEAHAAGFEHVNLDLIYGTPDETEADWQASLDAAIASGADHVSAYALVVEPGTAMARKVARGEIAAPDDDVLADRYVQADETLRRAGFDWYEVQQLGPRRPRPSAGTTGSTGATAPGGVRAPARTATSAPCGGGTCATPRPTPSGWRRRRSPAAAREVLDAEARHTEQVMLGVRLSDGFDLRSLPLPARVKAAQMVEWGLVDAEGFRDDRVVLTQRGRLLADAVVRDLLTA